MHPARDRPAVQARSRARVICDNPDSERATVLPLSVGAPQPFHAEQRRCRILGRNARDSMLIMCPSEDPCSQEPRAS